ncbi:twitching motility protein PilT [Bacteroidia bacterium]|nr:twitching motility protein PilT [Bacteroidia bacterium]
MNSYLIDTHIFIWFLTNDDSLNKNIREDIEYFQHPCYVSVETLREIIILQSLKKIKLDYTLDEIISYLKKIRMDILSIDINHVKALEKLPANKDNKDIHDDPFDRMLIAQSIAEKLTIVSSDGKFPPYRDFGLKLLVNEK